MNLLAIATNPHLYDKDGKGKMQEALFKRYEMQTKGDSPERQGRLRAQALKDMIKAKRKKKNGGNN